MGRKSKSALNGGEYPPCPNNPRHGGLVPDRLGGWTCEECFDDKKPRGREAHRWAFEGKAKMYEQG